MKHTPGPWKQFASVGLNGCNVVEMIHGNDYLLASTRFDPPGAGRTLDEMLANARLIAAAPDLLEACKQALWEWDEYETIADARKALLAAIQKAEGDL